MGDGFLASFPSVSQAIRSAVGIQRELEEHDRTDVERPVRVRIGIHAGDVTARSAGADGREGPLDHRAPGAYGRGSCERAGLDPRRHLRGESHHRGLAGHLGACRPLPASQGRPGGRRARALAGDAFCGKRRAERAPAPGYASCDRRSRSDQRSEPGESRSRAPNPPSPGREAVDGCCPRLHRAVGGGRRPGSRRSTDHHVREREPGSLLPADVGVVLGWCGAAPPRGPRSSSGLIDEGRRIAGDPDRATASDDHDDEHEPRG